MVRSMRSVRRSDRNRTGDMFEAVFESCPEGMYIVRTDGTLCAFNRAMERITGWRREEVIGKSCLDLFGCSHEGGASVCASSCPGFLAMTRPGGPRQAELLIRNRSGKEIAVAVSYSLLSADLYSSKCVPSGEQYAVGVMREVTQKRKEENRIRLQAITDELTGLFNYRYFRQRLALEIKRAKRYRHSLSIIMLDIDHFKLYNDLHGHPQGNEILKQMAVLIHDNTRETNIVARYGGEEFVVILPETNQEVAVQAAERLCSVTAGAVFPFETQQPAGRLTVSIGVASYPSDGQDMDALIKIVDDFLYQAKRGGRNRVHWKMV